MAASSERWGSRLGVILAVAGSAVGLGNFLRFPGQAAQHGGGAFMIPYIVSLVLLGIPLVWAEWAMGRYGGQFGFRSAPAIMAVLGRHKIWRYLGVLGLLIPIIIYMYYVLIESWCLGYAWHYLVGGIDLGDDPSKFAERSRDFFSAFVGMKADGALLSGGGLSDVFLFWIVTFALNFALIYRGVSKGIEWFCVRAMPLMAVCAIIVLARVLTLPANPDAPDQNVLTGLGFMWNPDFSALRDAETWLAAAGQIFFSISVGFGIIINYASYLRRDDEIALSGLTAAATNEFFEVCLGGLITIPAAFIFIGMAAGSQSTFGLGFNTLPAVFAHMPATRLFGFLWFFMLFLAAITSSLSMLQPAIAFLEEGLGIGRRASVTLLGMITALGSFFVIYFSKGLTALDTMDFWVGTSLIFVLAMIEVNLFAWVFGVRRGYDELMRGAQMPVPKIWMFVIKFISPVFLVTIFVMFCKNNLPEKIKALSEGGPGLYSLYLIGAVTIFLLILIAIAGPRWNAERADTIPSEGCGFPVEEEGQQ